MTLRTLDHFDVLERIGTGGMGAVFKARDRHLHRTVAVKLLLPEVNADAERRSRFLREGRAAGALNHPNIATIFEVGEVRMGREDLVSLGLGAANAPLVLPYIAMEYVEGRDLGELMEDRALDTRQALEVARQILAALGAAHAAGVVHRDLKPANILVGADGTTKLLDFGLAKILRSQPADLDDRTASQLTLDGTVMGTLPYLAPEQLQSSRVDGRADVFALGVILYEMLAGTTPYPGSTMVEYARAVLIEDIEPLSSHDPSLPPWIGDLTLRLLTTEPNLRPDVPQALAELERNLGVAGPRLGDGIDPGRGVERGPQAFVSSSSFETVPAVDGGRRFALMALGVAALLSTALVLWVALAGRGDHGTFDTGDPELAFVRGRELLAAGRLDEAQQLLSQATAQAGDRPRYWYYLGEVYRIQGLTDFARAAYDQARKLYEGRLEANPEDQVAILWWSFYQAKGGRCAPAMERLDGLTRTLPPSEVDGLTAARAYAVCGRTESASVWLARAIDGGADEGDVARASELADLVGGPSDEGTRDGPEEGASAGGRGTMEELPKARVFRR